jgi:2-oxo-4-hydroxy-4-carboxy-5-ureidoimidazoline decarboxylase
MATGHTFTLQEINLCDKDSFVHALSTLFEGPPWIVAATWSTRPFISLDHLYQALRSVMYAAPLAQKIALIQSHPDLVGRAALAGTLTPASTNEQASAGLDLLTPAEIATFTRLNAQYRERYDFPFVICARENKKESILAGFEARLQHTREEEIEVALAEIAKICALRLRDLVRPERS